MTPGRRGLWVVLAVVVPLAIALAACEATGWTFLRGPLQNALQRAAAVPVTIEAPFQAHLLWRPRLEVGRLQVGSVFGTEAPPLLDGRRVSLAWRWRDVWRWHRGDVLQLRALRADALDVRLERLADGRANWQLGNVRRPTTAPTSERVALPRIGQLVVSDARLALDDRVRDTQLRVELRGRESTGADAVTSGHQATIKGRYRALPLNLAVRAGGALPLLHETDEGKESAAMTPLRVEGEVGASKLLFDGQAAALLSARHLDGALRFGGPSLARVGEALGVTLPHTPPFDLQGRISHHNGVWSLRAERATIGRSELNGEFRYDTRARPSRLSGRLGGPRLELADLGPAIGAPTGGGERQHSATPRPARGRVLPEKRFDLPSLHAMDADVDVAIDELVFATNAMTPLHALRTQVLLDRGVLELHGLKAQVAGGQLSGNTRLDTHAQQARWAAQLQFGGVDIAGWVRGIRTREGERKAPSSNDARALAQQRREARQQPDRPPPAYLTGQLDARIDLTGTGTSTAEILSTLGGQAHVGLREGTMSHLITEALGLDVAQALGVAIRGDRPLPLRCARFDFATRDGVMHIQRGVFDNPDSTIRVAGRIDLRDETLALAARARPKDVSPLSLRAPVLIGGTLGRPQVGIEGKQLTGRVLGAVALGAVAGPLAAVIPLLDTGTEPEKDPCAASNQAAGAQAPPKTETPPR